MERSIQGLSGHIIICGFGRLGRAVWEALRTGRVQIVVIEHNPDLVPELEQSGLPFVFGSAVDEATLRAAGIERARAIVTATPADSDNVYIALSARELNPNIAIHARGESEPGIRRMRLAGAQQVVSLHRLAGQRIANAIIRPAVVDFIEMSSPDADHPIDLEEIEVGEGSQLVGLSVRELEARVDRLKVVATRRRGVGARLDPDPGVIVEAGDHVVAVGDHQNLRTLAALAEAKPE